MPHVLASVTGGDEEEGVLSALEGILEKSSPKKTLGKPQSSRR